MKYKALKSFQSTILSMEEGEVRDLDVDNHTLDSWTDSGLIEEVKTSKKKVKTDEN